MTKASKSKPEPDDFYPSTNTDAYYIVAHDKNRKHPYPETTERGGKWLVFIPRAKIDDAWTTVYNALMAGRLGDCAKVSTARDNDLAVSAKKHVIVVYTYDCDDSEDVRRIRQELRDLGFTWKLAYKTDDATYAGKYRVNGDTRISLYYE